MTFPRLVHDKIVIGVPVRNEGRYIRETLDSLAAQTHDDFLVLISDNASTDDTQAICQGFVANDTRFHYHRNESNVGASRNLNYLKEATDSPYFMWFSGHDVLAPDYLREQLRVLQGDQSIALAFSNVQWIDQDGAHLRVSDGGSLVHENNSGILRYLACVSGPWDECTAVNGLFRRSALSGSRFQEIPGPDHIVLTRAQFFGKFHRSEPPLYYRRNFAQRTEGYLERIGNDSQKSRGSSVASLYRATCAAQVRDYLSLPFPTFAKLALFPYLLWNLDIGYGCVSERVGRSRLVRIATRLRASVRRYSRR